MRLYDANLIINGNTRHDTPQPSRAVCLFQHRSRKTPRPSRPQRVMQHECVVDATATLKQLKQLKQLQLRQPTASVGR